MRPPRSPDVADTAIAGASQAFVDAMNSGFWLSAAVLAAGVAVAAVLIPNSVRGDQVLRSAGAAVEREVVRDEVAQVR